MDEHAGSIHQLDQTLEAKMQVILQGMRANEKCGRPVDGDRRVGREE